MEELKKLLGDELFNQMTAKIGDKELFLFNKGQKVLIDDGTFIPKYRLDEVIESKRSLQTQIEQSDKDLKELKKAATGNDDLVKEITKLQDSSKELKAQAEKNELKIKKEFAVKESLLNSGVSDTEARNLLALKFNADTIELDGDKVKGWDDLIKPIKENKAFSNLFGEIKMGGNAHGDGGNPTPISELEGKLIEAQKSGNTLEIISLKRQMTELKNQQ